MEEKQSVLFTSLPVPAAKPLRLVDAPPRAKDGRAGRKLTSSFQRLSSQQQNEMRDSVLLEELEAGAQRWVLESESRNTYATLIEKKNVLEKLLWFLHDRNLSECGTDEVRMFMAHVKNGHLEPGGRWGNPKLTKPVRPVRVLGYYNVTRALFNFLVRDGILNVSPVSRIEAPPKGADALHLFSADDINALLIAARSSWHPSRDKAIILFLYDTGVRAQELCSLRFQHIDMKQRRIRVHGKGDKYRVIGLGTEAYLALSRYLGEEMRKPADPLFMADRGTRAGEALQKPGLQRLIKRLGRAAGIETVRCSPHTFRHTFATDYLRGGGDMSTLQDLLGHTTFVMTSKYVHLAQVDVCNAHRKFSPADRLAGRNRELNR